MASYDRWNAARYAADDRGHYESWFLRANHPTRGRAFWIRYTIFSPKGRPQDAVGERWAIAFDGEANTVAAAKSVTPLSECSFSQEATSVVIGDSTLDGARLVGNASSESTALRWDLRYEGQSNPLLLFPERLYSARIPKAKVVVPRPNARFTGTLAVGDERWEIDDWVGSQNHNWGSQHTDFYAWGQVAEFDDAPGTFLEVATARLKLGPLWTPPLSVVVLRLPNAEVRLNTIVQAVRAESSIEGFEWSVQSARGGVEIDVRISADREAFVGLRYPNPPGGAKTCLNSKLARCEVTLWRPDLPPLSLVSRCRTAFEILTDEPDPAIRVIA